MSVAFANAVAEGLRHNGVPVRFIDGWDRRGNGQVSAYQGLSWHHTASNFGRAYATLWNGREGLSGPLCNSSGDDDGGITIVAAHPANHAGASGGRAMGPLPTTNLFNKLMWGHEIVYPGTAPMRDAQYRSAQILAGVISGILRRPNADWARGHAETSITGKWDPGYANGKTYDLNRMRAEVWGALNSEEDDMFSDADRNQLHALARRVDLGFARDQILTAIGVDKPETAPSTRTPAQNAAVAPARRTDVGFALDQIKQAIAEKPVELSSAQLDLIVAKVADAVVARLAS